MNENDNLKFNSITHGKMNMNDDMRNYIQEQQQLMESRAKKLEGRRITNVDKTKTNDTKKKATKALKVVLVTTIIYCMAVGIISSRSVDIKNNVNYQGSGSNVIASESVDAKEYLDEFAYNLNPVNLIETQKEIGKYR